MSGEAEQIPVFDVLVTDEAAAAVREVLEGGRVGMGEKVEEFERRWAERIGVRHAVAVSSCTSALHLACLAAGIGPGDEVIVPAITFVATAASVRYSGGEPRFCDLGGPADPQMGVEAAIEAIGPRTKAIMPVHFGGYSAPADRLAEVCRERGLVLLEDAAQIPKAQLAGRAPGSFGLAGCFSFFSNKVLASGEGGALVTDEDGVAELARAVRGGEHPGRGRLGPALNYRLDDARAALLLANLERLDDEVAVRRDLVDRYNRELAGIEGVELPFSDADPETCSGYVMLILVDQQRRQAIRNRLRDEHAVQTTIFPPTHRLSAYWDEDAPVSLPNAESIAASHIVLPLFPSMSPEQQERVVTGVGEAVRNA